MADEEQKGSAMDDAIFFFGGLAILIVLWYFAGGPGKTDLRGIFLSPAEPLGSGEAYGPQFGDEATSTQYFDAPPPLQDY